MAVVPPLEKPPIHHHCCYSAVCGSILQVAVTRNRVYWGFTVLPIFHFNLNLPTYLPTYLHYTPIPPELGLSKGMQEVRTTDNGPVPLLSVAGIIACGIIIQAQICVYISNYSSVYSCFRITRFVTLKCGIDHGFSYVKSPMLRAVLHQDLWLLLLRLGLREYVLHLLLCCVCRRKT
jgi:hypothetical protein